MAQVVKSNSGSEIDVLNSSAKIDSAHFTDKNAPSRVLICVTKLAQWETLESQVVKCAFTVYGSNPKP